MTELKERVEKFLEMVKNSNRIVFFGGAGVSTESGIPDFRSVDGIYNQKYKYPPETILSHTFFVNNTEEFFRFYRDKMIYKGAKPNTTHIALKKLEDEGKLSAIVTQNIDGLHEMAGSKNIYNLHGTIYSNHCERCGKHYQINAIVESEGIPRCTDCGGIIKPDVVLYEEMLPERATEGAINSISNADMLIIGGTSLTVYPAASYVNFYRGNKLVLINKQSTPYDNRADLVFHCGLGEVFSKLL